MTTTLDPDARVQPRAVAEAISAAPRVVVVGGGFGGLYAARALARAPVRVTLVDRHNYHLFRPMLYQVATGLLSAEEVAAPLRAVLRSQPNVDVLMEEVTGVDTAGRRVLVGEGSMPYDYLIVATGSHYNYFGHDDWMGFAPGLTTVNDAFRIRGRILEGFEKAERATASGADAASVAAMLTFVLVGAGPTGVELAGAIAELRNALAKDFRKVDLRATRILLLEAGPRILSAFPEDLARRSERRLRQLGVDVRTGTAVEGVDAVGVVVGGERIRSRTVLWAAGVTASPAGRWLDAAVDGAGRVKVGADMSVPDHPEIFVVGDTARVIAPVRNLFGARSGKPEAMPGLAAPAIQEGQYVASVIRNRLLGRPPPGPFSYRDKGNLAIVGGFFAIADLKMFRFWGLPGWLLWLGVHIFFLIGFANRVLVMLQWGISFISNRRRARIFPESDGGDQAGLRSDVSGAT
jgi:NADH dehydrogenase